MPRIKYEWIDASTWGTNYMTKWPLFSFGSNINPGQLIRRAPGSVFVSTARINFARLRFYGDSPTRGGVATLRPSKAHDAWAPGILTTLTQADVVALDRLEGNARTYGRHLVTVAVDGREPVRAFTYLRLSNVEAGPAQDYVDRIAAGYRFFGFDLDVLRRAVAHAPAFVEPPASAGDLTVRTPRQGKRSERPPGGRLGGATIPAVPTMADVLADAKAASARATRAATSEDHPGTPDYVSNYRAPAGRPVSRPYAQAFGRGGEPLPGWWNDANGRDDEDDGPDSV